MIIKDEYLSNCDIFLSFLINSILLILQRRVEIIEPYSPAYFYLKDIYENLIWKAEEIKRLNKFD